MSKLIDKLNQISKAAPPAMGFRAIKETLSKSRMLLVASLSYDEKTTGLTENTAGADAVLFSLSKSGWSPESLRGINQALADIPWGVRLSKGNGGKAEKIAKAGGDFLVFGADSKVATSPEATGPGRIFQIEPSLNDGLLRAVNELPVDAVLAGIEGEDILTWQHLMLLQRLADSLIKPLLVFLPADVAADEIRAIGETGIDGVIAQAGTADSADGIRKLRQIIDGLPALTPRRRGKTVAIIPGITRTDPEVLDSEEEEEE
ncbi:hypothetical protein ACFLV2_02230 [Chloroflexota bacterium]